MLLSPMMHFFDTDSHWLDYKKSRTQHVMGQPSLSQAFLSCAHFSNITVFKPLNICFFFLKQFSNSTWTMQIWHLAIFCMFYRKYIFTNSPTFKSFWGLGGHYFGLFSDIIYVISEQESPQSLSQESRTQSLPKYLF